VTGIGVLALLGLEAWQGTYVSWRYFDPADLAVRLAAAVGAAALAGALTARLPGRWATGRPATAIEALRPLAARPGSVVTVSGPQRVRVAVELDLPLGRVRDLFLATLSAPLDHALAGSDAVFHDADGDLPARRFAPLSTTGRTRVGEVELLPLRTDPERGLYVFRVEG